MPALRRLALCLPLLAATACSGGLQAVYPPRPPAVPGPLVSDPAPSRVVAHVALSLEELEKLLDEVIPASGAGSVSVLGSDRRYSWKRRPVELKLRDRLFVIDTRVSARVDMPFGASVDLSIGVQIETEPVVSADARARLQSSRVRVTSGDARLKLADSLGGALEKLRANLQETLDEFSYDLRPLLARAHDQLAAPIPLSLGSAQGCAELRVVGLELGPTVLAGGLEKEVALLVAPSVTLPCRAPAARPPLPQLANVAALPSGPFSVTVPVVARYEELQRAMTAAFTDGKLFISKEQPGLYLERPEVYQSRDTLVVKLHLRGPVEVGTLRTTLDGDLFMTGHPTVVDQELRVPDLEPTIETQSFLLKLAAALKGDELRDAARAALRLDLGARFAQVRERLSSELTLQAGRGCLHAAVDRIEVTGVYPHADFLRVYVQTTARAGFSMPCPVSVAQGAGSQAAGAATGSQAAGAATGSQAAGAAAR